MSSALVTPISPVLITLGMGYAYSRRSGDGILPNLSTSGVITLQKGASLAHITLMLSTLSSAPLLAGALRVAGVQLPAPPAQHSRPLHILPSSHPRLGAVCLWPWLGSPGLAPLGSWQPSLSQQRLFVSFSCQLSSPPASRADR